MRTFVTSLDEARRRRAVPACLDEARRRRAKSGVGCRHYIGLVSDANNNAGAGCWVLGARCSSAGWRVPGAACPVLGPAHWACGERYTPPMLNILSIGIWLALAQQSGTVITADEIAATLKNSIANNV